ncbi:MAG: nucleotidyltransferase domain-containing protein [Desulfomonile tiedjei]|nr:nucleotidyltransferase domain-containing protein [Desulfomonile tiedjei]
MLKALSDRPEVEKLERFLERLLEQRGEELEFVVLFGSMARGDWSRGSDYDVMIGLRADDGKRLIDRMEELSPLVEGNIEVFPYSRSEWRRMFDEFHSLLLEALEYGVVLWDRGAFAEMRDVFHQWRESGLVTPWRSGWQIGEPTAGRVACDE